MFLGAVFPAHHLSREESPPVQQKAIAPAPHVQPEGDALRINLPGADGGRPHLHAEADAGVSLADQAYQGKV